MVFSEVRERDCASGSGSRSWVLRRGLGVMGWGELGSSWYSGISLGPSKGLEGWLNRSPVMGS